jgi:hypothetical protein
MDFGHRTSINDIQQSAKILSIAMLNNPLHIGVFLGNGENERLEIEKMYAFMRNLGSGLFLSPKFSVSKIDTC